MDSLTLQQLAVSLGLGLLLGLQRERTDRSIAGIRTFPFIALFGTVCAQIAQRQGGWIIGAGLLALAAVVVVANLAKMKTGEIDPGITTEVATLLLYALGALLVVGNMAVAVVLGGGMAVLLHFKDPMHRFAAAVGERDMLAIMQFVVLTLIILPVLPQQGYGPHGILSPLRIWLMVVLIVGINLCGYVAYKLFGARTGSLLGGVIGGLISSTATTASYARRTASEQTLAPLGALVIMIASAVSVARVLVEIGAVASGSFTGIAPPLAAMLAACCIISAALYLSSGKQAAKMPQPENPAEFKPAFVFGALYAVILLAVAVAEDHFGSSGLYVVAVISGLTDMDAITLSTAQLASTGGVELPTAWRTILVAVMSNFVFKFGIVAALGPRALTGRIATAFGTALACGGAVLLLWPA
ncbi:MAG: DUF4010 domain-containing protein [Terrimicrobiaceae bacterium]|nr:DUF4010 domain-containing protein [Terrimicrobiaceae bacterium]